MIARYLDTSPPSVNADFGFHYPLDVVELCETCANNWHWTALDTLAQPIYLLHDMIRKHNLKDAVETGRDKYHYETVDDILDYLRSYRDDEPFEEIDYEGLPTMRFNRGD